GVERSVWLVSLAVAVNEEDLLGREPVDVAVGEVGQGAADGGPVGVVTATGHQDTELSHARPPPRSSAPPRTATARTRRPTAAVPPPRRGLSRGCRGGRSQSGSE